FTPDGKELITGGQDGVLKVWEPATGRETRSLTAHPRAVRFLALAPGGKQIVTRGEDGAIKVWDAATWREARALSETGDGGIVISPDGQRLIVVNPAGREARSWDVGSGKELWRRESPREFWQESAFWPDAGRLGVHCVMEIAASKGAD